MSRPVWRIAAAMVAVGAAAVPAGAQSVDSAAFIIRLGRDTTVVERYIRTADRLVIEAAQRSPSTMLHRLELRLDARGRVSSGELVTRAPGAAQPALQRSFRFVGDTAVVTTVQGGNTREQRVAAAGAIPFGGPFYTPYELAVMRALAAGSGRQEVPLLAGTSIARIPVERVGQDSVTLANQFGEPMRAHIDARGRLLHLHTPAYVSLERTRWIDLDRMAADFAERDRTGRGLGALSPRATSRVRVGAANVWLDYSRPGMRGRPIWGALVPFGEVWRMGANDAAHIATDRTIQLGDITLQPGTYTLFLLPTQQQWTLIANRATGMSGLQYDAAQDVGRTVLRPETTERPAEAFTMQVEGQGDDARLAIQWDRTRAVVPVRVR